MLPVVHVELLDWHSKNLLSVSRSLLVHDIVSMRCKESNLAYFVGDWRRHVGKGGRLLSATFTTAPTVAGV